MAIVVENTGGDTRDTSGSSFTLNYGFTSTAGNLLIAAAIVQQNGVLSDDGNWTLIGQGDSNVQTTGVWYKIETAPSTSAVFTTSGSNAKWAGVVIEISGHDPDTPLDTGSGAPTTDASNGKEPIILPVSLTPTVDNCLIFNGGGALNFKTITPSAGYTDTNMNVSAGGGGSVSMIGAYLQQTTAEPTGLVEHTLNTADDWWAWNTAVRPAGGEPPGPTIPPLAMHHQRQQR